MLPTFILPLLILLFQIPLVLRELLVCAFAVTLPFFSLTVKLMVANLLDYKDLSAMDRLPSQLFDWPDTAAKASSMGHSFPMGGRVSRGEGDFQHA